MKEIMEVLRVQRHDFLNHLQVISGLLQLKKYDRAFEYITQISQDMRLDSQITRLENPELGLNLMVLKNQASQRGIGLEVLVEDFPQVLSNEQEISNAVRALVDLVLLAGVPAPNNLCKLKLTNEAALPKLEIQIDTTLSSEGKRELDNFASQLTSLDGEISWRESLESPLLTVELVFQPK